MHAQPPAWYVVQYKLDPPIAVPLSSAAAANSYCAAMRARGNNSYLKLSVSALDSTSIHLLENLVCGDASAKRSALRVLNRHLLDVRDGWASLWACAVCDGEMYEPSKCGCCARPDCAVYCGCRCPSEYWCDICRRSHENAHLCLIETGSNDHCDDATPNTGIPEPACLRCDREPSGRCPQCDAAER